MTKSAPDRFQPVYWLQNLAVRGLFGVLLSLPYRWRIPVAGWCVTHLLAPIAGYRRRVRDNLKRVLPDLPISQRKRLEIDVPNNAGRTLIEVYSGAEFANWVKDSPVVGAGLQAILDARERGQGVIIVAGHFGNYDVIRAVLTARGYPVGALYKIMRNPYFDKHYRRTIGEISQPIFTSDRRGLAEMVKFLRSGGMIGMLVDQHKSNGANLTFYGHIARTALSAAEMSLKYNLLLVPANAIRQPDGLSFQIEVDPPIPTSDPATMTQALNDSLEHLVRQYPEQWFWIHRRWRWPK
jgi:KDO2-lipid IV(A) lauroyltransferase